MTAQTILLIIVAAVVALSLVVFMYGYKTKYTGRLRWVFGLLRFITLFSLLLLLINPKFKSVTVSTEKPKLAVLVDNSASIVELKQETQVNGLVQSLRDHQELNDKFDLQWYRFGEALRELDSLSFSDQRTDIDASFRALKSIFQNQKVPVVLVSDGNQTLGNDYEFTMSGTANPVYPVIAGDSTRYTDLKIEQLNTNRYSFLKNQFPVEAVLVYSGEEAVSSQLVISQNGARVFTQEVRFSDTDNVKTITTTLPASSVGLQRYTAQLLPLEGEQNTMNNRKNFAVEVIDQATNVLVVSAMLHPDNGLLKKSIETNEQRRVTQLKPADAMGKLDDYQLVILYQPDRSFSAIYEEVNRLNKNTLTLTGLGTDWNFLNRVQDRFRKDVDNQSEEVSGVLNPNFGGYAVEDIGFDLFPPLKTQFGEIEIIVPHEVLLEQAVDGFLIGSPLLATMELNGRREAILDGQGLWRWRSQVYLDQTEFVSFDEFIGNIVQFLASNKRRSRLEVAHESFYYNNSPLKVAAQYFDKNFVFDNRVQLEIRLTNEDEEATVFPMLLKNNYFEVDLSSLPAGTYNFTVTVQDKNIARSGSFTILEFNVEQQFLNANVTKLERVATHTGGETFFMDQQESLINSLVADDQYVSIQKTDQKIVPLIDWKYLLGLMVLALASEWFIRKYNGLI